MRASYALVVLSATLAVGAASVKAQVFDVQGFEGYAGGTPPASVVGQPEKGSISNPPPVGGYPAGTPVWTNPYPGSPDGMIVSDTTGANRGKVLSLSPAGSTTADIAGAYLPFGQDLYAAGMHRINIDFDQFRGTTNQDLFVVEEPALRNTSWAAYEYGVGSPNYLFPTGTPSGSGQGGIQLTPGKWQHVHMVVDFDANTVTAMLDGNPPIGFPGGTQTFVPNGKHFHGIGFLVVGAPGAGVNYFDNLIVGRPTGIPEPSSLALLATALGPLALLRRRRV